MAADDVLNIRAEPNAQADKIGELAHDATDVEVVDLNDDAGWGLVNSGEGSGWVSMRFMTAQPVGDLPIAARLSCGGTEPFWSLDLRQNGEAVYSTPDGSALSFMAGELVPADGRRDRFLVTLGKNGWAVMRRTLCSDGMSDMAFGVDLDLYLGSGALRSGCCSIATD
ncbi:SH3 domain-containing protein [Lutimaribacter marinistellae]|uniref:SH3 domain-containing protein n=1 Tax=Lutimaribacter marinistellae TaxID=1820329 RepID=A0ABV7TES5_9RHOB